MPTDDGPDLGSESPGVPMAGVVAELEIGGVEELAIVGMRHGEEQADLAAVNACAAVCGDAVERQVKSGFEPIGDAPGPFSDAVQIIVVYQSAREGRGLQADGREVVVPGKIEHAWLGNGAVVYLDLVGLREDYRRQRNEGAYDRCQRTSFHWEETSHQSFSRRRVFPFRTAEIER